MGTKSFVLLVFFEASSRFNFDVDHFLDAQARCMRTSLFPVSFYTTGVETSMISGRPSTTWSSNSRPPICDL